MRNDLTLLLCHLGSNKQKCLANYIGRYSMTVCLFLYNMYLFLIVQIEISLVVTEHEHNKLTV